MVENIWDKKSFSFVHVSLDFQSGDHAIDLLIDLWINTLSLDTREQSGKGSEEYYYPCNI